MRQFYIWNGSDTDMHKWLYLCYAMIVHQCDYAVWGTELRLFLCLWTAAMEKPIPLRWTA